MVSPCSFSFSFSRLVQSQKCQIHTLPEKESRQLLLAKARMPKTGLVYSDFVLTIFSSVLFHVLLAYFS